MREKNNQPIGFFDSGVGGLTVVRELFKQLPNEKVIYIGDAARAPYGPRTKEQVLQFSWELTRFLEKKNIKMLVIACNTATAFALKEIRESLDIPVVGVILPGSRAAIKATKNKRVAVLGTKGTVDSGSYTKILKEKNQEVEIFPLACPKFVPIVESNQIQSSLAKKIVAETLQPLKSKNPDTVILGCTHYPLLRPLIQEVFGEQVVLIDSGAETVSDVSMLLDYFSISADTQNTTPAHEFYTTGNAKMFSDIAKTWLDGIEIPAQQVSLFELDEI